MNEIQIPLDPENLGGAYTTARAEILKQIDGRGIACVREMDGEADLWVTLFRNVYFQTLRDGKTLKAIRLATDEDIKQYRVAIWIQDEEVPECCGRPMEFIGQIDDDRICTEPPAAAELWWHDAASFYVFTCSRCLGVQAVGQQF